MSISEAPWAEFMEDTLHHMVEERVQKVIMVCVTERNDIAIAYTDNVTTNDLALGSFWLTQEASDSATVYDEDQLEE